MRLHHVQVSAPRGAEDAQRTFYADALGMVEVDKPAALAARGGCWFRAYDESGAITAEVHVGVEEPFSPALKAHPALAVDDLDEVIARLLRLGFEVDRSQEHSFPGARRCHCHDGAGNRVELLVLGNSSHSCPRFPM